MKNIAKTNEIKANMKKKNIIKSLDKLHKGNVPNNDNYVKDNKLRQLMKNKKNINNVTYYCYYSYIICFYINTSY